MNRGLVNFHKRWFLSVKSEITGGDSGGRQCDIACSLKVEQKASTDHIPQLAVSLGPVPDLTKFLRQGPAAHSRVFFNEPFDQGYVFRGSDTATVFEIKVHGIRE